MSYLFISGETTLNKVLRSARHSNVSSLLHVNPETEIIIVTSGAVLASIGKEQFVINSSEAAFVMPFEPHSFNSIDESECHVLMFSADIISPFFDMVFKYQPITKLFKISEETLCLINKITSEAANEKDLVDALACIAPILSEIKCNCTFTQEQYHYDDIFLEALNIINKNFQNHITLETTSKEIGINPATLSRKFSKTANVTFNTYLNSLRCCYAAKQILNTNLSLSEIAFSSGFGSIRTFNRNFLNFFNCSPTDFKNTPLKIENKFNL